MLRLARGPDAGGSSEVFAEVLGSGYKAPAILVLALSGCATLSNCLNLSGRPFSYLQTRDDRTS